MNLRNFSAITGIRIALRIDQDILAFSVLNQNREPIGFLRPGFALFGRILIERIYLAEICIGIESALSLEEVIILKERIFKLFEALISQNDDLSYQSCRRLCLDHLKFILFPSVVLIQAWEFRANLEICFLDGAVQ